jgi:hypothetical protein
LHFGFTLLKEFQRNFGEKSWLYPMYIAVILLLEARRLPAPRKQLFKIASVFKRAVSQMMFPGRMGFSKAADRPDFRRIHGKNVLDSEHRTALIVPQDGRSRGHKISRLIAGRGF